MDIKFYRCNHCGNIIVKVHDSKVPVVCCGEKMVELVPGVVDASLEKHVPQYVVEEDLVSVAVGSTLHPMLEEHHIEWICLVTNLGYQIKHLVPGGEPKASFKLLEGEEVLEIYEYCNLHGLWKTR